MAESEKNDYLQSFLVVLIFISCGFCFPIMYASKIPDVIVVFPGIAFLTIGNYFIIKRKQFWEPLVCCILAIFAIGFGIFELFKEPIFSDGFTPFLVIVILIILLLVCAFLISILHVFIHKKYLKFLPVSFSIISTILFMIIIEYISSFYIN